MNTPFILLISVFTGSYVVYFVSMISYDLYKARRRALSLAEEFDISDFKGSVQTQHIEVADDSEPVDEDNNDVAIAQQLTPDDSRLDKENVEAGLDDVSSDMQYSGEMTEEMVLAFMHDSEKEENPWAEQKK